MVSSCIGQVYGPAPNGAVPACTGTPLVPVWAYPTRLGPRVRSGTAQRRSGGQDGLVFRQTVGEGLALVVIVCCIPFVILAIGLPIVLFVRLLLWVGGVL